MRPSQYPQYEILGRGRSWIWIMVRKENAESEGRQAESDIGLGLLGSGELRMFLSRLSTRDKEEGVEPRRRHAASSPAGFETRKSQRSAMKLAHYF